MQTMTEKKKETPALAQAPTRRQVIAGSAMALGGLATAADAQQASSGAIHQEVDLHASPKRVYETLLDDKLFSAFSGERAEIHREAGGAFTLFGDRIVGRNIELVPNQRIVQAWRPAAWPKGVYSIVKFELKAEGSGTRAILDHTGFAPDMREHLEIGWQEHYWGRLKKYFA
jgi:activator of HSP90 ATPase